MRQHNRDREQQVSLAKLRRKRYLKASLIQSSIRGYMWRKELRRMKAMALAIQCIFRIHKAVEKVEEERRRRSKGPPVIELLRHMTVISGVPLLLVGQRCASNYKFIGYDFQRQFEYVGYVYKPESEAFIDAHNAAIEGPRSGPKASKKLLTPWKHKLLMEELARNLSIVTMLPSATAELGGDQYICRNQLVLMKSAKGKGITDRSGVGRVLNDTKECIPQGILEGLLSKSAKIHF
jgi:hypothetical protein